MGCNMCVVRAAEEQRRGARQGKEHSRRGLEPGPGSLRGGGVPRGGAKEPLVLQVLRKRPPPLNGNPHGDPPHPGPPAPLHGGAFHSPGLVDSGTQTDISFESRLGGGPEPPQDYFDPTDPGDPEHPEELEYEEVELYRPSHRDKLGLTVCYRTDGEEDAGIYVGEVNPNSIAAKDGRIREGDRIIQINGVEVQDREEAVTFLTRQQHCSVNLLLARPDCHHWKDSDRDDFLDGFGSDEGGDPLQGGGTWTPSGQPPSPSSPSPCPRGPEPDSGVGRTDESRNDESSEHDLLGDEGGPPRTPTVLARPGSGSSSGSAGRRAPPTGLAPTGGMAGAAPPGGGRFSPGGRGGAEFAPIPGGRAGVGVTTTLGAGAALPGARSVAGLAPTAGVTLGRSGAGFSPNGKPRAGSSPSRKPRAAPSLPLSTRAPLPPRSGFPSSPGKASTGSTPAPGPDLSPAAAMSLPGPSAAELHRYRQLRGRLSSPQPSQQRSELVLLEEELRHLEFKCRHLLRAHAMERLRQRCLHAWLDTGTADGPGSPAGSTAPLADIAEERAGSCGADSTSSTTAYNTSSSPQLHAAGSESTVPALPLRVPRAKRPGRDRLLKARAIKILEERAGSTTDDDARSELKTGRYWSRQQRKQHLARAREQRRRREMLLLSRSSAVAGGGSGSAENPLVSGGGGVGPGEQSPLPAAAGGRRGLRKRSRRILDNWATIQEMLARGGRGGTGGRGDNPLLSVTTV